jgi:lycopene cyclase CruP
MGSIRLSDNVMDVLNTPDLETPEGMSAERMFLLTEAFWKALKSPKENGKVKHVVRVEVDELESDPDFDVCVCGGTLGIGLALCLQMQGQRVCIVEKRRVEGRRQEWNISRDDFRTLTRLGMLTMEELEECIATSWSRDRICFHQGSDMWVQGALDLGVDPKRLISILKDKFVQHGGVIYEHTVFEGATVHSNGVQIKLSPASLGKAWTAGDMNRGGEGGKDTDSTPTTRVGGNIDSVSCRLVVDCMGHYSPIVKQQRHGQPVEGVVLVVGGCMTGLQKWDEDYADLLVTLNDSENDMQYFWEAFPAEGGKSKTVYMFAYTDAEPSRPSFDQIFNTYLTQLETYQNTTLDSITFKRILMGGFPCYSKNVPLQPAFDRIIQIGDASAVQSPLSFGGFASLCRHLPRVSRAINHALVANRVKEKDLAKIHPYLPNLSVAWLFQRAMSIKVGQQAIKDRPGGWISPDHINRLMRCNFAVMSFLGPKVMLPFIQDSFQAIPLGLVMMGMLLRDPLTIVKVVLQLGPRIVFSWMVHYTCLVGYTILHLVLSPFRNVFKWSYTIQRILDALEWGSGLDDILKGEPTQEQGMTPCNT